MIPTVLADGAPSGAGLAIVGVILLALFLVFLGIMFLLVRFVVRRIRRRRHGPDQPGSPTQKNPLPER